MLTGAWPGVSPSFHCQATACVCVPVSKLVIIAFDSGMMGNFGLSADTYTSKGTRERKKRLGTLLKGLRGKSEKEKGG